MFRSRNFLKSFSSGSRRSYTSTARNVIRMYIAASARRYLAKVTDKKEGEENHVLEILGL